jgi:hypothetical protein
MHDVFAPHVQIGTKPPCPVHPDVIEKMGIKILPRIETKISRVSMPVARARRS